MGEIPTIFSGPMVAAILAGRKTQTRRLFKGAWARVAAGDRLWVREAFALVWPELDPPPAGECRVEYRADLPPGALPGGWPAEERDDPDRPRWRSPIRMPRPASRITLAVTAARREPLRSIAPADAEAEGVFRHIAEHGVDKCLRGERDATAVRYFAELWDSLHRAPGTRWDDDPEVVAVTFERAGPAGGTP